jgi:PAS domain S-box-containing protein
MDITARKASVERQVQLLNDLSRSEIKLRRQKLLFESVFQSAPDPIILTDLDGLIVNVNPAFTRIFHYELDEIAGTSRILYQHASDCDRILRMGEEHKHISDEELISFVTRSGDKFPGRISSSWLLDDTGRTIGYLRIIRDVSVEERRKHELQEKQRLEALGRVTGGIAHDFNNMLAIISGNLQFLGTEHLDGRAKRYLGEAMRAVEMGTRLNKRLLTFAQKRTLAPVPVDLNKLITSLLDLIKHTLEASIKVVVQLDASPAEVRVDESEMENAIINLVLNARDALPDGGIVTIQTFERTPDASQPSSSDGLRPMRYVYLSVSDNGIGMTEHVKTRAFEPFFTTKAIGAGTGLGLSTIKGFVRQSGGKVSLESEVGKGTTIEIALPACEPTVDTLIADRDPYATPHQNHSR